MVNKIKVFVACVVTSITTALLCSSASAQEYPSKPITIVIPFAAGSGTDQNARAMAQAITDSYGISVVVENKSGASGSIAAQHVARSKPDGYTVFMTTNTTHAANEHMFRKLPYDPVKDFEPVSLMYKGYMALLVSPKSPYKTTQDLIDAARKAPGKLTFGSGNSSGRVGAELLKQMTSTDMLHIPYRSNPMVIADLIGGQIDFMFADAPTAVPQVKAGTLRALAVSGFERLANAPDVPTLDESGVKGFEVSYWGAGYLPAGTPANIVAKFNEMMHKASASATVKAVLQATNLDSVTSTSAELAAFQAVETAKWGKIIRAAGIQPE